MFIKDTQMCIPYKKYHTKTVHIAFHSRSSTTIKAHDRNLNAYQFPYENNLNRNTTRKHFVVIT